MKLYFVALLLPENLDAEIRKLKMLLLEKWGCRVGLKSPAHITLIPPFWMDEKSETLFTTDLDLACRNQPSFIVETNDFAAFKPRTLFIEPKLNDPLKKLKLAADAFCKTHVHYGARADARPFHPHITLATRDLQKQAFAEAWAFFEKETFQVSFGATGLSVLRHNTKNWEVIYTAPFDKSDTLKNK
ncbi:MAG TPA: 2'-5' RNA ligase family protein [Chitinophagaceae bacterium]|nr:2'-5' RNA ligase family protein [Chitinophagaceae bacterium]